MLRNHLKKKQQLLLQLVPKSSLVGCFSVFATKFDCIMICVAIVTTKFVYIMICFVVSCLMVVLYQSISFIEGCIS